MPEDITMDIYQIVDLIYEAAECSELLPTADLRENIPEDDKPKNLVQKFPVSSNENTLTTHLKRVIRLNHRLDSEKRKSNVARQTLDTVPLAVVTLDKHHSVIEINNWAKKILLNSHYLALEGGKMVAACKEHLAILKQCIEKTLLADELEKPSGVVRLKSDGHGESICLFPVKNTDVDVANKGVYCTLFIVSNLSPDNISLDTIQYAYQLTPAETRLAKALLCGHSLKDISQQLNITHNTARTQLKSVFSKTGANRQAELVKMILSLPAKPQTHSTTHLRINSRKENHVDPLFGDKLWSRLKKVCLEDKNTFSYYEYGAKSGMPVLYFHDFFGWNLCHWIDEKQLQLLNIRLIVFFRRELIPINITSTSALLRYFNGAANTLLDKLSIERCYLLGFSAGGMFAASMAHHLGERCLGLSLVSSYAPISSFADINDSGPALYRLLFCLAKYTPKLYRKFSKAIFTNVCKDPETYLYNLAKQWPEYDRQLFNNQDLTRHVADCFVAAFKPNMDGAIDELKACVEDWGFDLANIQCPTQIWFGEQDSVTGRQAQKKLTVIKDHKIYNVPEAGRLFIYHYWSDILDILSCSSRVKPSRCVSPAPVC